MSRSSSVNNSTNSALLSMEETEQCMSYKMCETLEKNLNAVVILQLNFTRLTSLHANFFSSHDVYSSCTNSNAAETHQFASKYP